MIVRARYLFAAALGLCVSHLLPAQEPGRLRLDPGASPPAARAPSANQRMADAIARQLRQDGQLKNYRIEVAYRDGTAELTGTVADQPQRDEALHIVQGVPGVERVLDRLALAGEPVRQARAGAPPAPLKEPLAQDAPQVPPPVGPPPGPVREPMPLFHAHPAAPHALNPPRLPPHAWPTYAPYNNFSRVAYPTAYPYNAWPFIGPCYPFPKVPLGWRSVKLEWEDGYWWFSRTATKYGWWRLKFW